VSSFTTPLVVTPLDNGRDWKLVDAFEYHVGSLGSGEVIRVPAGFVTDFASVPRVFWRLIPPWGRYGKATVIHDYCYRCRPCSRRRADRILLEAMRVLSVAWWKRTAIYLAVRAFGWIVWRKRGNAYAGGACPDDGPEAPGG
jgi:hypothetical protein